MNNSVSPIPTEEIIFHAILSFSSVSLIKLDTEFSFVVTKRVSISDFMFPISLSQHSEK